MDTLYRNEVYNIKRYLKSEERNYEKKLSVLGEYVAHLLLGLAMAATLLVFEGALNMFVHWAEPIIKDNSFLDLMKLVEKLILYADVAFLIWWAFYSTYKAIKEMLDE